MWRSRLLSLATSPAYPIYKLALKREVLKGPMPHHVGIIPDGNRRWARENSASLKEAYYAGYSKIKQVLHWILDLGVPNVTVFVLSTENCSKRSFSELSIIMDYVKLGIRELLEDPIIQDMKIKIKVIGDTKILPEDLKRTINDATASTQGYKERTLTLAICYGGRQEILDVAKQIAKDYAAGKLTLEQITEEKIREYLYLKEVEDIDLVIRTSGEIRISNFLLWHIAYSELYFCEAYWPDFRDIDLWRAIRSYQRRQRKFGK